MISFRHFVKLYINFIYNNPTLLTSDDVDSSLYDHYQAFYIYNPSYNLYFLLQVYLHYHNNANIPPYPSQT